MQLDLPGLAPTKTVNKSLRCRIPSHTCQDDQVSDSFPFSSPDLGLSAFPAGVDDCGPHREAVHEPVAVGAGRSWRSLLGPRGEEEAVREAAVCPPVLPGFPQNKSHIM